MGDRVQIADMEGPEGLGVITDWWPVRQALRVAGQPDHLHQAAAGAQPPYAGMSGLFVSEVSVCLMCFPFTFFHSIMYGCFDTGCCKQK